jgi:hypothetical protein
MNLRRWHFSLFAHHEWLQVELPEHVGDVSGMASSLSFINEKNAVVLVW